VGPLTLESTAGSETSAGAGSLGAELSQVGAQLSSRYALRLGGPTGSAIGEGWASKYVKANGDTKAQAEAFEKGELEREEVGMSDLGNGYGGYPAPEPGRPPIINLPGAPISTCHGQSAPSLKTGTGPGVNAGKVESISPCSHGR
jgi:hypothetical protein